MYFAVTYAQCYIHAVYHTTNVTRCLNVVSMLANIHVGQELTQCANVKSLMCDHSGIRMLILEYLCIVSFCKLLIYKCNQNVRYCGFFYRSLF